MFTSLIFRSSRGEGEVRYASAVVLREVPRARHDQGTAENQKRMKILCRSDNDIDHLSLLCLFANLRCRKEEFYLVYQHLLGCPTLLPAGIRGYLHSNLHHRDASCGACLATSA